MNRMEHIAMLESVISSLRRCDLRSPQKMGAVRRILDVSTVGSGIVNLTALRGGLTSGEFDVICRDLISEGICPIGLRVGDNKLTNLPDSIGLLTDLQYLNVGGNKLGVLPDSICLLDQLTDLVLSQNKLASLPDSIGLLVDLRHLQVVANKLCTLPESMVNLSRLEELDLAYNKLTSIPTFLESLPCLRKIWTGSAGVSVPDSISRKCTIIDY